MNLLDKIELFLEESEEYKIPEEVRSVLAIKKLINTDWGSEKYLRPMLADCFIELSECNDDLSEQFLRQMSEAAKSIGSTLVKEQS